MDRIVTNGMSESRSAIRKLIDLYLDNVPLSDLDRELLAETVYEGLSDELDRLYRIEATCEELANRYSEIAAKVTTQPGRQRAVQIRQVARDLRCVLLTRQLPPRFRTDEENAS